MESGFILVDKETISIQCHDVQETWDLRKKVANTCLTSRKHTGEEIAGLYLPYLAKKYLFCLLFQALAFVACPEQFSIRIYNQPRMRRYHFCKPYSKMPPKKKAPAAVTKMDDDVSMGDAPSVEEATLAHELELNLEEQRIRIVCLDHSADEVRLAERFCVASRIIGYGCIV